MEPGSWALSQTRAASRAAEGVRWNIVLFPAMAVISAATTILVVRRLSIAEYALFVAISATAQAAIAATEAGLAVSLARFIPEIETRSGQRGVRDFLARAVVLRIATSLVGLLGLAALVSSGLFPVAAADEALPVTLLAGALVVAQPLAHLLIYFLSGRLSQRASTSIQFIGSSIQLAVTALLIYLVPNATSVIAALVIALVVEIIVGAWLSLRGLRSLQTVVETRPPIERGRFVRFAAVSYVDKLTSLLGTTTFILVLSAGRVPVDIFASLGFAAAIASQYGGLLLAPFGGLLLPVFSTLRARGAEADAEAVQRAVGRGLTLLALPSAGAIFALSPVGLPLVLGRPDELAVVLVQILCLSGALELLVSPMGTAVWLSHERFGRLYLARVSLIAAGLISAALLLSGAPIVACVVYAVVRVVVAWAALSPGKLLGSWFDWGFFRRLALTTVLAWSLPSVLAHGTPASWVALFVFGTIGLLLFVVVFLAGGGLAPADRHLLFGGKSWTFRLFRGRL